MGIGRSRMCAIGGDEAATKAYLNGIEALFAGGPAPPAQTPAKISEMARTFIAILKMRDSSSSSMPSLKESLLKKLQVDVEPTANQKAALKLAEEWDAAMVDTYAAMVAEAKKNLDANRSNRAYRVLASKGLGAGAMVVGFLPATSLRPVYALTGVDASRVAKTDSHWRYPRDPELAFSHGNMGDVDDPVEYTAMCAIPDGLLVVEAGPGRDTLSVINLKGNIINTYSYHPSRIYAIATLPNGWPIMWHLQVEPGPGIDGLERSYMVSMLSDWGTPPTSFLLEPDEPEVDEIAVLGTSVESESICIVKSIENPIKCYLVADEGLHPMLDDQFPEFDTMTLVGMCQIPASCPCECGKAACKQGRLAGISEIDGRSRLYILAPGAGLLHEYALGDADQVPIRVALADWRRELVILFRDRDALNFTLYACQLNSAGGAEQLPLRKLEIDLTFCDDVCERPRMVAGYGQIFISSTYRVNGYRW